MQLINNRSSFQFGSDLSKKLQSDYDSEAANNYRNADARDIKTPASREVIAHLRNLSRQFEHKTNVLDVGCGTGRFFHALENVKELTGLDLSEPMLLAAKKPVKQEQLDVESIKLVHSDFLTADLPQQGFDLIYAVGVFGHPAPIDKQVLDRFYRHLAPGGCLFFTIANKHDSNYERMFLKSSSRRFVESFFRFLPHPLQVFLNQRWQNHFVSQLEMEALFKSSQFSMFRTWPMVSRFIACEALKV